MKDSYVHPVISAWCTQNTRKSYLGTYTEQKKFTCMLCSCKKKKKVNLSKCIISATDRVIEAADDIARIKNKQSK